MKESIELTDEEKETNKILGNRNMAIILKTTTRKELAVYLLCGWCAVGVLTNGGVCLLGDCKEA